MSSALLFRVLKYLINVSAFLYLSFFTIASYAIIVQFPPPNRVREVTWSVAKSCLWFDALYILPLLGINFVFERYLEKKKNSKEFLILTAIQLLLLLSVLAYCSWEFYSDALKLH